MISFGDAPAVPLTYQKVSLVLTKDEQDEAIRFGYITSDKDAEFRPAGSASFNKDFVVSAGIDDWRNRMFLIWFCFIFENMHRIPQPLAALEEVLLELQGGPLDFDEGLFRLSTLYAGAAARGPLSAASVAEERRFLEPYYHNAARLLEDYRRMAPG